MSVAVDQPLVDATEDVSVDPVGDLVDRVRPRVAHAVDAFQVAAALETEGVTDRVAVAQYGHTDVFELADEVYRRLGPTTPVVVTGRSRPDRRRTLRDLSHGGLYLLPSAAFPAALATLGRNSLVLVVVLAGGLGWVWSGGTSWFAYRLLGHEQPPSAARLLRWAAIAAFPMAALLGIAVTVSTRAGYGLIAMAVAMMTYQMASTLLIFYGQEAWLAIAMGPAVAGGVAYVVAGDEYLVWSLVAATGSIAVALLLGLRQTVIAARRPWPGRRRLRETLRIELRTMVLVGCYSALAATFLLHAQAPYLLNRLDIALAVAPLLAGMGVVEWRARRFVERASGLLVRARTPRRFVAHMLGGLLVETAICMTAVAVLAVPLFVLLDRLGALTPEAMVMSGAAVVLAGGYFLSFVLAGQSKYGWLTFALGTATAAHVGVALLWRPPLSPLADLTVFLGSAVLLDVLLMAILAGAVGQAWRYRINRGDDATCMP
jgi:hypothetical protein